MAATEIKGDKITKLDLNDPKAVVMTAVTSADPVYIDFGTAGDEKLVILVNASGTSITLKKGNGIQGVTDITETVNGLAAIRVDSGLFKKVLGTPKGIIEMTVSSAATVGLVQLP